MEPFPIGEQKTTQIVNNLQVLATFIGSHLTRESTASPVLTKWWNRELMLASNFGYLCQTVIKVDSQNFGYQICTRLLLCIFYCQLDPHFTVWHLLCKNKKSMVDHYMHSELYSWLCHFVKISAKLLHLRLQKHSSAVQSRKSLVAQCSAWPLMFSRPAILAIFEFENLQPN